MKMSKFVKDLTGKKFSRLKVIEFSHSENHLSRWICECDCGKKCIKIGKFLSNGHTKSCGCLMRETSSKNAQGMNKKSSQSQRKEGIWKNGKRHPLYNVWKSMKARCYRATCREYKWYGNNGIKVYDLWINDPVAFIDWGEINGYQPGLQIDRIDRYKDYCPSNCEFVTRSENLRRMHASKKGSYNKKH